MKTDKPGFGHEIIHPKNIAYCQKIKSIYPAPSGLKKDYRKDSLFCP